MDTTSLWQGTAVRSACLPTLQTDIRVDVAIVGAGITGLTLAMLLAQAGKRVAVLDAGKIGDGSTARSTGNLYATVDLGLAALEAARGPDAARTVVASRAAAVDLIESTIRRLGLQCGFQRVPWHMLALDPAHIETIEQEHAAALRAGLPAELLPAAPIAIEAERALAIPGQAQFQPLDYVRQLAQRIGGADCLIFENTRVLAVDDQPAVVHTPDARVACGQVVLATHTPPGIHLVQSQLEIVREYGIAAPAHDAVPDPGIYWCLGRERHSVRTFTEYGRTCIVAVGSAHPTGEREVDEDRYHALIGFARDHFPLAPTEYRWSTQRYRSKDKLPFIGRNVDVAHTYIATGFSGDGLTYGTLSAMLLADELLGRDDPHLAPWRELYRADRLAGQQRPQGFERESAGPAQAGAAPVLDRGQQEALHSLPPGEARKIQVAGQPVAVYRDADNRLHAVSGRCSHMGCELKWNGADTSWDCHCHGSRFAPDGAVLEGPALAPLAPARFDPPPAD